MAGLPPDGQYLIQCDGGMVTVYDTHSDRDLLTIDVSNPNSAALGQAEIHNLRELNDEQKAFAHFWSGYFYAHAK